MARYRSDLDGLRAVAVVAVLAFHAFPRAAPGGFIGVDVFFVISGYLITGIITRDLAEGTFSVLGFYRRRVRRIVPALVVVLAASSAVCWVVLTPVELKWFGKSAMWSSLFLGNGFLATSGGYFEDSTYLNPLLHLWSLGVEEQFYLLWPLLLMFGAKPGLTRPLLIAVAGTSFMVSIWGAADDPTVHFYHLSCRAWELGIGALLAVSRRYAVEESPQRVGLGSASWIATLTGITLIVGGALVLSPDEAFPGGWSLVPVGGAALVIAAGSRSTLSRCLLGNPASTFLGRISYPLYLWHWPLLAGCRIVMGRTLAPGLAAAVLACAFVLACATCYLVENPIRFGRVGPRTVPALLTALVALALTGAAMAGQWLPARLAGAAVAKIDEARIDWEFPRDRHPRPTSGLASVKLASRRPGTVLFVGDSHMQQYWPRVRYLIGMNPDAARSAEFVTYLGCPPLPGVNAPTRDAACDRNFAYAIRTALRSDVDTVVFGGFWEAYFLGEYAAQRARHPLYSVRDRLRTPLALDSQGTQRAFEEFQRVAQHLVANGRRVFILLSNPTSPFFDPTSMLSPGSRLGLSSSPAAALDPGRRSIDAAEFEQFVAPVHAHLREVAAASGATLIDPRDTLCDGLSCEAMAADGTPLYKDTNHLRPFFARERATFLDQALLLPDSTP